MGGKASPTRPEPGIVRVAGNAKRPGRRREGHAQRGKNTSSVMKSDRAAGGATQTGRPEQCQMGRRRGEEGERERQKLGRTDGVWVQLVIPRSRTSPPEAPPPVDLSGHEAEAIGGLHLSFLSPNPKKG